HRDHGPPETEADLPAEPAPLCLRFPQAQADVRGIPTTRTLGICRPAGAPASCRGGRTVRKRAAPELRAPEGMAVHAQGPDRRPTAGRTGRRVDGELALHTPPEDR